MGLSLCIVSPIMKVVIVAVVCLLSLVSCEKPVLGLHFESYCPGCHEFIKDEIYPVYQTLSDYFDVDFVPYGNAHTHGNLEDGFTITCQHGEKECKGNELLGCTLKYVTDKFNKVYLMNCINNAPAPERAGETCFAELGLDYSEVKACYEGEEGRILHYHNGEKKNNLSPEHAKWVPWPTWNGVSTSAIDSETSWYGIVKYLCKHFYDNNLPNNVCNKQKTEKKFKKNLKM